MTNLVVKCPFQAARARRTLAAAASALVEAGAERVEAVTFARAVVDLS